MSDDWLPLTQPPSTYLPPTAADFYVSTLPGLSPTSPLTLFSGLLPATISQTTPASSADSDAKLFFLLAANRHIPVRPRLLIWLQGGPGCSASLGAFIENGPLRVEALKDKLVEAENSWNEYSNVLYLDQPAGTGFSVVNVHDDVRELATAADQVVVFLSNFYKAFPEMELMDTYISGESYAGQWIPYIADAILRTTSIKTPLKGLLIGNGWISPRIQYPGYLSYLLSETLIKKNSQAHRNIEKATQKCSEEIERLDRVNGDESGRGVVLIPACEEILGVITANTMKDGLCLNLYDTRQYQKCGLEWPPPLGDLTTYLGREDVVKALHASPSLPRKWNQCSNVVGAHFWTPKSAPAVNLLPALLKEMRVLLYHGDKDLMCSYNGAEDLIEGLEWNGEVGFNGTEPEDWVVDSKSVGQWTTARNLSYVRVFNSSHMVPMDLPLAAHDMLLRFMEVDTLHAAGHSAKVPSRIGAEIEAVIGATLPNGTTLPSLSSTNSTADLPMGRVEDEDGFDRVHEAFYGPRRTALVVLLLLGVVGFFWGFLRWRRGRGVQYGKVGKIARPARKSKGKGRGIRLEDTEAREMELRRVEEMERVERGAAIFDLGEEGESSEDDGDIGHSKNPWSERRSISR